ncbi:MAG: DUF3592 domain-containing protein [Gammaproteobacteria bacterium HGW-Gammaproteobacteria-14]|nr:MAG: DUF3592 domain-containing protein [Gammaproteobacteria bacterium HGW-Gammaproteobacteria-14]
MLFGLPFFAAGLAVLWFGPFGALWQHARSANWERVPAYLESVALASHRGSDSTTYEVTARYRYHYQGRDFVGERVGYDSGKDNLGKDHQQLEARLKAYQRRGQPLLIWVNPAQPQETYLVRELRWKKLSFMGIFGLIFATVGGGVIYAGWRVPVASTAPLASGPIYSAERRRHWFFVGMGLLFVAMSSPGLLAIPEELDSGNTLILVVLLFPLVGLGLLWSGFRGWQRWRFYGPMPVLMDPQPGQLGGDIGGRIELRIPWQRENPYRITLQCLRSQVTGSGKNRSRSESVVWQQEQVPFMEARGTGTELRFVFEPPDNLPPTESYGDRYHLWKILLCGPREPVLLERTYTIPVVMGRGRSRVTLPARHISEQQQRSRVRALEQADRQIRVTQQRGGVQVHSPFGLHIGMKLALLLFGLVFAAAATFLWRQALQEGGMLWFMAGMFSLFGYPMLLSGLFVTGRSLTADIQGQTLRTIRYWCGIPLWRGQVSLSRADQLTLETGAKSSDGRRHSEYFHLQVAEQGRRLRVAEDIAGREAAEALRDSLIQLLRLR